MIRAFLCLSLLLALLTACPAPVTPTSTTSSTWRHIVVTAIDTLDPEGAYDTASGYVLENIYETLYGYKGESLTEYTPLLATSYSVSADKKEYTFILRQGVTFHSGNAFTCRDVEYSFERNLVMNDKDSGVWFLAESLLGTGKNANDDPNVTWQAIENAIECIDSKTARFTLAKPDIAFFSKLLYTNASVIDSQWAIANGEWDGTRATWRSWVGKDPRDGYLHGHASGTGAYKLKSIAKTKVTASAFADYWAGKAYIDTIEIAYNTNATERLEALKAGRADRVAVSYAEALALKNQSSLRVHTNDKWYYASAGGSIFNQDITTSDNPYVGSAQLDGQGIPADFFRDSDVRKGFAYSFAQQSIIDGVYQGYAVPSTMVLPTPFLGYDANLPYYDYNQSKAEEAFCSAFNKTLCQVGFKLTIVYNKGNRVRQKIAETLEQNIEAINGKFQVETLGLPWPEYLKARTAGKLPVHVVGWSADYADPDNFIHTFHHSDGYYDANYAAKDAQVLDELIEQARTTYEAKARANLYRQIGRYVYDNALLIPTPRPRVAMVTSSKTKGVSYNPMLAGAFLWKDIRKD